MDEMQTTPLEKFAIMLNERVGVLEEALHKTERRLESETDDHVKSQFHYFEITKEFPEKIKQNKNAVHDILDIIFKSRKEFAPQFAHWDWCISDDDDDEHEACTSSINMYVSLCLQVPMSMYRLRQLIDSSSYKVEKQARMDYARFVAHMNDPDRAGGSGYRVLDSPDTNENDLEAGSEAWLFVWVNIDGPEISDPNMNNDPFTKSSNYNASIEMQSYLHNLFNENDEIDWYSILKLDRYI
jgi:hypothetical protein